MHLERELDEQKQKYLVGNTGVNWQERECVRRVVKRWRYMILVGLIEVAPPPTQKIFTE